LRWCVSDSAAGLTGGGETLSGTGLTSVDVELKLLTMMVRSSCYLLAIYTWPNDQYVKPGSGQTQGKLPQNRPPVFLQVDQPSTFLSEMAKVSPAPPLSETDTAAAAAAGGHGLNRYMGKETGKKTRLLRHVYIKPISFYQDRLGTNIGKTHKRRRRVVA
jgi:hypothetical protein